jgi:hypothetical protein
MKHSKEQGGQSRYQEVVEWLWSLEINVRHSTEVVQHMDCALCCFDSDGRPSQVFCDALATQKVLSVDKNAELICLERKQYLEHHVSIRVLRSRR